MLNITDCRRMDRPSNFRHVVARVEGRAAEIGLLSPHSHCVDCSILDALGRLRDTSQARQMIDPSEKGNDDQNDDSDRNKKEYEPALLAIGSRASAMIPTRLKRNDPMNVASTFCVVLSSMTSFVARGVTLLVAAVNAETIVLSENVVTASMLLAMMPRMLSTASAPIFVGRSLGI